MNYEIKNNFADQILTSDERVKSMKEYETIIKILSGMIESGFPYIVKQYCISAANMVHTALKHQGINSKIVECQLMLTYDDTNPPRIVFVGYDGIKQENEIDTHVVVITETSIPLLIDASIQNRLSHDKLIVLDGIQNSLLNQTSNHLGTYSYPETFVTLTYEQKTNQKVPMLHQNSILDRINTDRKIFDNIEYLKKLNYIGIGLSIFAVIAVINQFLHFYK